MHGRYQNCEVLLVRIPDEPLCAQTGYIDYDKLEEKALDFRPKMLICGGSAYPREWDYARLYSIARKVGALLMCDMAHYRCAENGPPHHQPSPMFRTTIKRTT